MRKSCTTKKSQTATEYLIILAVVIVIALIVIGVLGGIPSIGGGVSKTAQLAELGTKPVGVTNYAFQNLDSKFKLQNNQPNSIKVNSIWIDQTPCGSYDPLFPFQMKVGESEIVSCGNIKTSSFSRFNDLVIEYVDMETGAVYNTAEGLSAEGFKGISVTDCNGTDADSDGYYDICTCDDLNDTRNDLARDYELLHNIDFFEPSCAKYRVGEGWEPIGLGSSFEGIFNGNNNTIHGLYINRGSTDEVGLFSHVDGAAPGIPSVKDLILTSVSITGNNDTGAVTGLADEYVSFDNVKVTGAVNGGTGVGGIIGDYTSVGHTIYSSSFSGAVSGSSDIGGLAGHWGFGGIHYSYATGTVSGDSNVGGILGRGNAMVIRRSFSTASVSGNSDAGGLAGEGYSTMSGLSLDSSCWYNNSDSANTPIGNSAATEDLCTRTDCSDSYDDLGWLP